MKIGARVFKTGLAITLSIYLASLLGFQSPSGAAVAATFAIQPSVYRSWQSIVENVQGNVIGAFVAVLFLILIGANPILIGIAVIIVIMIHLKLKLNDTIPMSVVTIILMMSGVPSNEGVLVYALTRFLVILCGVLAAFIVNIAFLRPNYEKKLYKLIFNQTTSLFNWVRLSLQHTPERSTLKNELRHMQDTKLQIGQFYLWYREERNYFKKGRYAKHRKIVVFRQMMTTTNKLNDILRLLSQYERLYYDIPEPFKNDIQERIEGLMTLHERVLLRFNHKVRKQAHEHVVKSSFQHKTRLAEGFFNYYEVTRDQDGLQLFPLIAAVVEYSQNLEHFDRLVDSFQSFHQKENVVDFNEED
jgi:uncharacterized membrane protein YgaE (UPF0421/DUF939 family)